MPIIDRYYYLLPSSEEDYCATSTNRLKIERVMLASPEPWIKPSGAPVRRKKTLILHHPTADKTWDQSKRIVVQKRLKALQEQGFEIYVYQADLISKLDINDLSSQGFFYPYEVSDKKVTEEAVQALEISAEMVAEYLELKPTRPKLCFRDLVKRAEQESKVHHPNQKHAKILSKIGLYSELKENKEHSIEPSRSIRKRGRGMNY